MDRTGQVLNGRYEVERILGQGGMGAVYLARQVDLGQRVAVKEMLVGHTDTHIRGALANAFRAEARILNRLHHPNLPRVYDFFEAQNSQFLVMEYIEGGTLQEEALRAAPTEAQVLGWTRELCDVLEYLHHHNPPVIFKDLKPNNVMVAKDGTVRLIDFGIAKVFDPSSEGIDTVTALKGTVSDGFAPIEQYGQGSTDVRSDIYGLGATLYAILTRQIPPAAPDRAGGMDPLVPLSTLRPDLSDRTTSAIEWMLQINREARPRSISEVVDALGLTPSMGTPKTSVPARTRRFLREEFHHFFPSPEWVERPGVPLQELADFLRQDLGEGRPAPLLGLYGAPGIGKSRVIHELCVLLRDHLDVLPVVQTNRLYREQPLDCILPAMRLLLRRRGGALLSTLAGVLDGQILQESSSALPELKAVSPLGPFPRRSPAEMTRSLVTTLMAIFAATTADRPALLVLDDVQWADPATMRLLDHLRSSPVGTRVALLLAWHSNPEEEPHRAFIETWHRDGSAMVEIPPLSPDELQGYVHHVLPPWPQLEAYIESLTDVTSGNPLALEELLRLLVVRRHLRDSHGVLQLDEWRPEHLPRQVEETIRRRLEHLPLDSQAFLGQAAVAGRVFTVELLQELSGEPDAILREGLQRAREACFIRLSTEQAGTFEFISEATRQVFYDRLSPLERTRLHRTIGIMEEDRAAVTGEISHAQIHHDLAGGLDRSLESLYQLTHEFLSPRTLEIVLGELPEVKHWDASADLPAEELQTAHKVLAMLVRTVRSRGSFGGQTYVSEMAQEALAAGLFPLLESIGPLTVTCAEAVFSINGRTLPAHTAPAELRNLLARHRLSGFQLRPGLTKAELFDLIDLLIRQRENIEESGGWTTVLRQRGIIHATVSEMIYVGVSETELFDPSRLREFQTVTVRESRPPREPQLPPPDLDHIGEFMDQVRSGRVDEKTVLARLESLSHMLEELRKSSAPVQVLEHAAPAPDIPVEILELAQSLLAHAIPAEIARILSLARTVELPLVEIMHRTPQVLLHDLELSEANLEVAAITALVAHGRSTVPVLLNYLARSDHARARASVLHVLRRVAPDLPVLLTRRVLESSSPEEACRLLSAMEMGGMPWSHALAVLLHSPSPEVRRAAYGFFQRTNLAGAEKARILTDIIKSDHPGLVADALRATGVLRLGDLIPVVTQALKRTFEKPADTTLVHREACHALGRIGKPQVLPLLRGIVFPGLVAKKDPEVRSAALWAIGRLPGEEAGEVLERCFTDRDPLVRAMAKVAFENRQSASTDPDILAQLEQ